VGDNENRVAAESAPLSAAVTFATGPSPAATFLLLPRFAPHAAIDKMAIAPAIPLIDIQLFSFMTMSRISS
jgi:hypothetical protein